MSQCAVLLVEDEIQVRVTIERALRHHGFTVTAAGSAIEARQSLLRVRPDVLLTDVTLLDRLDGFELASWARRLFSDLPMVIISGLALSSPPDWALADAAVRLLAKPFRIATLLATLREVTGA